MSVRVYGDRTRMIDRWTDDTGRRIAMTSFPESEDA